MLCGEALSPGVCPALRLFSVFAAFLQTLKSFSRHLQHSCKVQKVFRGLCSISANPKKFIAALAELPQASKWGKWRLRNFRKHQNGENGVCGTSASVQKEKVAFAELPQASKRRKWRLRNFRKHPKGESGVCRTPASVQKEKMAFAELPQRLTCFLRPPFLLP